MSDKPAIPESLVWYRESVTWLTALASAAIAAGAAAYQRVETLAPSQALQWVLILGGAVFLLVIVSGVICYSYLTQLANAADNIAFYRDRLGKAQSEISPQTQQKLDKARESFEASQKRCRPWYVAQLYGYGAGAILFAIAAVLWAKAEPRASGPAAGTYAFSASSSGTLILDTRTGQTWRVIETKDGLQLQQATPVITPGPR